MKTLKIICIAGVLLFSAISYAEEIEAPQSPQSPQAPQSEAPPAPESFQERGPWPLSEEIPEAGPKVVLNITFVNGSLGVELENAPFGKVMTEIANRAGFEADVSSSIGQRTLNTKFGGVELKRGILRLLSLIGQKTYFVHYDKEGAIKKIEVYGTAAEAAKKPPPTVRKGAPRPQTMPPGGTQPYFAPSLPSGGPQEMVETPEAPYIPPKEAPVFIPPPPAGK